MGSQIRVAKVWAFPLILLAMLSMWTWAPTRCSAQNYLYGQSSFATGNGPVAVAAADLNGDGNLDLAVVNQTDGTVSILLGNASGAFAPLVDYAAGNSPVAIAVADFNGDGKPDLVLANSTTNSVSVLLGNGDGTFQSPVAYKTGNDPVAVVAVDLNGDGKPDLAVANKTDSTLSILLGNGNGTFQSQTTTPVGAEPLALLQGDFNGDGIADLVTSNFNPNQPYNGAVSVFLNNGNASFRRIDSSVAGTTGALTVGDFNGDGKLDVVVTTPGSEQIVALLGNGDGTFKPAIYDYLDFVPGNVAAADFNRDGKIDVAVTGGPYLTSSLSVLLGNGDGTFQQPLNNGITGAPVGLAAGDFNRDGVPDIAVTDSQSNLRSGGGSVCVFVGNGNGTMSSREDVALPTSYALGGAAAADFNADGKPDIAVVEVSQGTTGSIDVLLGNGNGTFQNPVSTTETVVGVGSIVAADFNGDGKADIASSYFGAPLTVLLSKGDGTFQAPVNTTSVGTVQSMLAGDFNRDGKSDLAIDASTTGTNPDVLDILLSKGDGTFQINSIYSLEYGFVSEVASADFNGDGNPDLAVTITSSVLVFLGNGDGTFKAPTSYNTGSYFTNDVVAADFNGDGKVDLAVAAGTNMAFFAGNGDGTFQGAVNTAVAFNLLTVQSGDFNGDGKPDLLVTGSDLAGFWVMLGNGNGTFQSPLPYQPFYGPYYAVLADFNSDGTIDLAMPNTGPYGLGPSVVSTWLSAPTAGLSASTVAFASQLVGTSSAPETLTLTNVGNAPLTVTNVTASGDFTETNACGSTLGPNSNCAIEVTFTPSAAGLRTGTLTISDSTSTSPQMVGLSGTGNPTSATVMPASLSFATQVLNTTSAAQPVTLSNTGMAAMSITSIAITGANSTDFAETNNCGSSVAAGASCTINVTFTPTTPETLTAAVTITDDASSGTQTVALTGTGQGLVQIPGSAMQIEVGANGAVWAINSSQEIYTYNFQTQTWTLLPGRLVQLSVGADGALWGINAAHDIFRFDTATNNWDQVPGQLVQIAVGYTNEVWGVNASGQIFRWDPGISNWDQLPGLASQVTVGPDGSVWAINSANAVYHFNARKQTWDLISGAQLTQVAVGYGGVVWGVNAHTGKIYQYSTATQSFALVAGTFTEVSVGRDGTVWAIDAGQADAYRYDPSAPGSWDVFPMTAPLAQISVGYAGAVWAVDSSGNVYELEPTTPAPAKALQQVAGALAQVAAAGDGNVWGINSAGQIYAFNSATQGWDLVSGALSQIAVGFGGAVWGINSKQQIFNFNPQTQSWTQTAGLLTQIAVGSANAVWGINASGQVYQCSGGKWYLRSGLTATQISVAADGTVWGLNAQQQIYSYNSTTQSWQQVGGLLKQVAVGSASAIWGINASEEIYSYNTAAKTWDLIPGLLKQLGVGFDGVAWGFNSAGTAYEYSPATANWNEINGSTLSAISVGSDEIVWGLNGTQIYRAP